jgi:hypothetical protein
MNEELIPADVRDFILECIESVAQLEALLLLRSDPEQGWNSPAIAQRLYIDESEARVLLSNLVACELAISEGDTFRFAVRDAEHGILIDDVAQAYRRYLVPVTKLIHDKSQSIRKFADAFRFRKDQ